MTDRTTPTTRRHVLRAGALACAVGVAGCTGGGSGDSGGSGGGSGPATYGDWLDNAPNYDGSAADRTGQETVTVAVGAGNGLLFEPVAVEVSPGTTVVWEWTGRGGQHNVREEGGAFESELASSEGTTYERTFDEPGVVRYYCVPHQAVGMKGVVDVVDVVEG
jgi:halocyanin-like protein